GLFEAAWTTGDAPGMRLSPTMADRSRSPNIRGTGPIRVGVIVCRSSRGPSMAAPPAVAAVSTAASVPMLGSGWGFDEETIGGRVHHEVTTSHSVRHRSSPAPAARTSRPGPNTLAAPVLALVNVTPQGAQPFAWRRIFRRSADARAAATVAGSNAASVRGMR